MMKFLIKYFIAGFTLTICCKLLGLGGIEIFIGWMLLPIFIIALNEGRI